MCFNDYFTIKSLQFQTTHHEMSWMALPPISEFNSQTLQQHNKKTKTYQHHQQTDLASSTTLRKSSQLRGLPTTINLGNKIPFL
jgi:hypothetical protein